MTTITFTDLPVALIHAISRHISGSDDAAFVDATLDFVAWAREQAIFDSGCDFVSGLELRQICRQGLPPLDLAGVQSAVEHALGFDDGEGTFLAKCVASYFGPEV